MMTKSNGLKKVRILYGFAFFFGGGEHLGYAMGYDAKIDTSKSSKPNPHTKPDTGICESSK